MAKKKEKEEVKEVVEKKDSDLILSRFDTPTKEEREPVTTVTGPNNMFKVITY